MLRLILLVVLLSSCAPQIWVKSGVSESQRERDLASCELEGRALTTEQLPREQDFRVRVTAFEDSPNDLTSEMEQDVNRAARQAYRRYFESSAATYRDDCMTSRGYSHAAQ